MKKILHLTLKKKWFDMILSGEKKEEYREMKPYWFNRLYGWYSKGHKQFDYVHFRNGYNHTSPSMLVEFLGVQEGYGVVQWGAPEDKKVYKIKLGKIIKAENIRPATDKSGL